MARPSKLHKHKGQFRTRIGGKEYYLGADERKARHEFYKLLAAATKPTSTSGKPQTIAGVIPAWRAEFPAPCYSTWMSRFEDFAGGEYLDEVPDDLLTQYRDHLLRQKFRVHEKSDERELKPETLRHYMWAARSLLLLAVKRKWLAEAPDTPRLPDIVRKARDIPPDRLRAIIAGQRQPARRIFEFLAATGCRPSEACNLRWEHVRLDLGVCLLPTHKTMGKSKKPRTIYLGTEGDAIIRPLLRESGPVFISTRRAPYTPRGLFQLLRGKGVTPYQFRHTFAQHATDRGVTTDVLAAMLGHSSEQTVKFYREMRDERVIDVANRLRLLTA